VFAFVATEAVTIHVCSFTLQVVDTTIVMAQTSPMLFVQYMKTALISSGINMSGIKFPPSLRPPPPYPLGSFAFPERTPYARFNASVVTPSVVVPLHVVRKRHIKLVSETERCRNVFIRQPRHVTPSQVVMFIVVSREVKFCSLCLENTVLRGVGTPALYSREDDHVSRHGAWPS
jgi:hypothetical protein